MVKHGKPLSARQLFALEHWIVSGFKSKAKALRKAGYSESIAQQPHKVFNSPLVNEELAKRGYDSRGVYTPPRVAERSRDTPHFDLSKLTTDDLQTLKERLEAVDGIPLVLNNAPQSRYSNPHVPTGKGSMFDCWAEDSTDKHQSYSSL